MIIIFSRSPICLSCRTLIGSEIRSRLKRFKAVVSFFFSENPQVTRRWHSGMQIVLFLPKRIWMDLCYWHFISHFPEVELVNLWF